MIKKILLQTTRYSRPVPFVITFLFFFLPLHLALAEVIGTHVQLGHFGLDTYNPIHDFSPAFQHGAQGRTYPYGSSAATAGAGTLSLSGQYTSIDYNPYGNADLKLNSYFADTVTIDAPGRTGQAGTFTVSFTFDGSYDANLWFDTTASITCGFGTDAGDGTIPNMSSAGNYGLENGFTYRGDNTYGFGFGFTMFLGQEQTATIPFTFGQPFDFWLRLGARLHISESEPGDARLAVSLVKWSGLKNIAAGGAPVIDATISSVSTTNWMQSATNSLPATTNQTQLAQLAITPTSIVLSGTNGPANGPLRLVSSPDLSLVSDEWPTIYTSRYGASGEFSISTSIALTNAQGFFRLQ